MPPRTPFRRLEQHRGKCIPKPLHSSQGERQATPNPSLAGDNRSGFAVNPSEEGYVLLAAIFLLFLLLLSLAIAAPEMRRQIQRDHEVETMHRGKQYIRAIQLYYHKFHAYPPNIDALVNTNGIRFLRKRYTDPITGKDDWKPVLFGQNKAPTAMGFFGQPLTGSSIAGIGPSGGNGVQSGVSGLTGGAGSTLSSLSDSSASSSSGTPGTGDNSSSGTSSAGTTDNSGTSPSTGSGTTLGSTGATGATSLGSTSGQTFGGAGIIGFSPASPNKSILVYKTKDRYNEWEFVYDPIIEQRTFQTGNTGLGTQGNSVNSTSGGNANQSTSTPTTTSTTTSQ